MQPAEESLYDVLDVGLVPGTGPRARDLTILFEFYEYDTLPGPDGFDPADAVERFAKIEYTWLGHAYRRVVLSAPSVTKAKGSQAGRFTLRLSNADENRYAATWINSTQVEGMRLVVRLISRSASTTLAASNQRFSGRCDKPEGFDVIQGSISATEDVGGDDVEFPSRLYLADDPEGRSPSDPLNEGFPWITLAGSFSYVRPEQDRNFARNDARRYIGTLPYSSFDDTPLNDPIPMILGRSQIQMNRGLYVDRGRVTDCLDFACMGPIAGFANFRMLMPGDYARYFAQPQDVTFHLGEEGGTGTQIADPIWVNHPLFSFTAYISYHLVYIGTGAFTNIDAGHATVATVLGLTMKVPDSSGVFDSTDWSDDGAVQTRHLLIHERFFGHDEAFIEDPAAYATHLYNAAPLVDQSNSGLIYIPSPDIAAAGVDFQRFRSTSLVNAAGARYLLGLSSDRPAEIAVEADDFEPFDPEDPPLMPVDVTRLTKRHTTNVLLKKRVKAKDFLFKTLLPSFRGYLVWNRRGRIDIRSERPADFAHLRSSVSAGATTMPVEDVTPWTATGGLWGRVLLGTPLTTSEVRKVNSAAYTADANSITLTASKSGSVTVSASGATLTGGNSSTKATGTATIGGSPAAGDTVTVTIQGIPVVYTVESSETAATVAYMVAAHLNANTELRRFVSAVAVGAVVTVSSKWGVLTLAAALANSHSGPVSNPTAAPAGLSSSGSGSSLLAGVWRVAYANRTANGSTYLSPYSSVTVTAGQNIAVPALAFPAGVTSRDWFVSKGAGDPEMVLYANDTTAGSFNVTAPPLSTATFPPEYNTTGEELVRVAMSFASNNQTAAILAQANQTRSNIVADSYKWPGGRDQSSYTETVGTYVSAVNDYAESKVIVVDDAKRARLGKKSPKELDLTAVDNYNQARRLVYFDSAKFIDHHWFVTLKSNGLALLLEEGDVICVSDDSGGHVNVLVQVEEFSIDLNDFTVTINRARLYSTGMFREFVPRTRPVLPSVLRWVATLDTEWEFIDLPAVRPGDFSRSAFYVVATFPDSESGDWKGWSLWADYGAGYSQIAAGDTIGTLGTVSSTLAADDPDTFDPAAELVVVLKNGTPVSLTQSDLEADPLANLAVYGDEYLQYAAAVETDPATHTWTLTGLYRGRLGTLAPAHSAGQRFALMDARALVEIPPALLNLSGSYQMLTVNQSLGDVAPESKTWTGGTLKYPPVGVQATLDANGDWRLRVFGQPTADPEGELYKLGIVGGRTFDLRGAQSRPVSLSTVSVSGDSPPPPGKGSYRDADAPGNSVTAATRYVVQMIQGEGATLSATWRTDLDETSPAGGNLSTLTFSSGASQSLTLTIAAQTSTDAAGLTIADNLLGTVFTDPAGEATGTRYSAEFVDGKVKFYRNRGAQSEPFYVHTPPNYEVEFPGGGVSMFPSEVQVSAGTDTTWDAIELDDPGAAVVYYASEQEADFGSAQATITVRASQQRVVGGVVVDGMVTELEFP